MAAKLGDEADIMPNTAVIPVRLSAEVSATSEDPSGVSERTQSQIKAPFAAEKVASEAPEDGPCQ